MAKKFLVGIDLDQNELQNAVLHPLATDPGTPLAGQVWTRTDQRHLRFYDGTAIRRLAELVGSGAVGITYNVDGTVTVGVDKAAIDALDVDADTVDGLHSSSLLSRANHTGGQAISTVTGLQTALDTKVDESREGAANGIATLDASSKLPVAQLPDVALGGLSYQGTWDAATNTPTLGAVPAAGVFYKVSASGATNLSGITDWNIGDWAISDGTAWQKIDNTDQVSSVAGKSGAVTLEIADITGLVTALDDKSDLGHGHALGDITNLPAELNDRPKRYTYAMSVAAAGPMVSTHNLNTLSPTVEVYDVTTGEKVEIDVEVVDANNLRWDWIGSQRLRFVAHG